MSAVTELPASLSPSQRGSLNECLSDVETRRCIAPTFYVDETLRELETAAVFNEWVCAGRSENVAHVGDFHCVSLAGHDLILTRDEQGAVHALANTCRHRGTRLLDGSGNCQIIRCPFHSWAYRLDGTLAGAPQFKLESLATTDRSLTRYASVERFGFVFVAPCSTEASFDQWSGGLGNVLSSWRVENYQATRIRRFEVPCNWKAFLDVFNEYYHLPYVHPDTISDLYFEPEPGDAVAGAGATQFGITRSTGALLQGSESGQLPDAEWLPEALRRGVRYSWVFPNLTFAVGADAMWSYVAWPITAERTLVEQSVAFPSASKTREDFTELAEAYYERMDAAIAEDIEVLRKQQAGMSASGAAAGPMHSLLESNVAAFAEWYARRLLGKDSSPSRA